MIKKNLKVVNSNFAPGDVQAFDTNLETMDWLGKYTRHIAPNIDHDKRYKEMYTEIDRMGLKLELIYIDYSDTGQFIEASDDWHKILQPRLKGPEEREQEIQATMRTLYDEDGNLVLDRLPILADLPGTTKKGKLSGYKRTECLRRNGEVGWAIIVKGANDDQLARLARLSNAPTQDDVEPLTEEDHIHQYTFPAQRWMYALGIEKLFAKSTEEADLTAYLKALICKENYKYCDESIRLGHIVNNILDILRDEDSKRYAQPIDTPPDDQPRRDEHIDAELKKFSPHSTWDITLNSEERTVFQFFSSGETHANTKQSLDTLLEKPECDALYNGKQSLQVVDWVKFKAGKALEETVTEKIKSRVGKWTALNKNSRRKNDYSIPPVERLFFPATFTGLPSRMFEWDKETQTFIEKMPVV